MLTANLIRQYGLKATPQRLAVYTVLHGRTDHPSVERVYDAVRTVHPTISLNTVYRTLESLEAAGAVRRVNAGGNAAHYDARITPHAHIVCDSCGAVEDLFGQFGDRLPELATEAEEACGYQIRYTDLSFFGRCPTCRNHPVG